MTARGRIGSVDDAPQVTLSATGLTKDFGSREAVSELTFGVATGRAFGLLGPNGAGKTTTVRLLTGLLTPTRGHVRLFGQELTGANADALRRRVGVQTDTNLYEALSVRENLRTWGELYGLPSTVIARRAADVLDVLGLSDRADSRVGELSKGMRQKVSVARAVLHEPELLFLDEPTAGLDPEAAVDLIDHLRTMVHSGRTTLVICTHQLHGLDALCQDVGILKGGRLVAAGSVAQLLYERWPQRRYVVTIGGDLAPARDVIARIAGEVTDTGTTGNQLGFSVSDEAVVSTVVSALVHARIPIRAVTPEQPTVQDLYFATIDDGGA